DDGTGAQVREEFARVGHESGRVPQIVGGDFNAEQNRVDRDEVHANGGTDNTIGGAGIDIAVSIGSRTDELAAQTGTNVETFPVKTGRSVDRLRRGRDDEVGGLSAPNHESRGGNANGQRTYKHVLHSHRVNRSRPIDASRARN